MLSEEKVSQLNGLIDELQISIHCPDEQKNSEIFKKHISFENIKKSLENKKFFCSINSTFNKAYDMYDDKIKAIKEMENLVKYLGADKLRLTELKKVSEEDFRLSNNFFPKDDAFTNLSSDDLITKGCTRYYTAENGIQVSVKRLCKYAKGEKAPAFSCCFINTEGQLKIDVKTKDTFKVIYSDGSVKDDWIFKA